MNGVEMAGREAEADGCVIHTHGSDEGGGKIKLSCHVAKCKVFYF